MAVNGTTVQVEGLKETRAAFRRIGDKEVPKALTRANKSAAQLVVDAALPNVPIRTGRLKATVKALGTQTSGKAKAGSARVSYSAAIHFGVGPRPGLRGPHNIKARPFLHDAAERTRDDVVEQYEAEINRLIEEAFP